jgi:transposase
LKKYAIFDSKINNFKESSLKVFEPKNLRPYCQSQRLLFPPNLREVIADDDLCLVVDEVVNLLDLSALYAKVPSEGNLSYHPKMMLKIVVYAYASGIFSSRKIAKALGENVAFIYLAAWQRPDFRTINNFRKNNLSELDDLFVQIVRICQKLKMVKLGHISIDSSRFKANAADRRSYDRKRIAREIKRLLDQAEEADQKEDAQFGPENSGDELPKEIRDRNRRIEKLKEIKKQLDQEDKEKLNATDADAVFMKTTAGIKTAYNAQAAVDEHQQVIIAADVTNQSYDVDHLLPMVDQAQENTASSLRVLSADAGYSSADNLERLEARNIDAYIPDDQYQSRLRGKKVARFDKDNFGYDPRRDVFICPEGKQLPFVYRQRRNDKGAYLIYQCSGGSECGHWGQCTTNKKGRTVCRRDIDEKIKQMRLKLDSKLGKAIYAKRKVIVEPVFGQIKAVQGFTDFKLRGLKKVNAEFKLVAIAHNVRKMSKYIHKKGINLAAKLAQSQLQPQLAAS